MVNRYESHIKATKNEVLEAIKNICDKNKIDYNLFETAIADKFDNKVKF